MVFVFLCLPYLTSHYTLQVHHVAEMAELPSILWLSEVPGRVLHFFCH